MVGASLVKLPSDESHWTVVMISQCTGDGLMPSGIKPLPEPMLTLIYVTVWSH